MAGERAAGRELGPVPLHWPLEFPEVFVERGGFDAVVGNPPFLGGPKITPSLGLAYRQHLVSAVSGGVSKTNTDLIAFFLMRCRTLVRHGGGMGVIATNSLAQGDTRVVGLDQLIAQGWCFYRAVKSRPWPARSAALEYCAVWASRYAAVTRVLDGRVVSGVTSSLNPESRVSSSVSALAQNRGKHSSGTM
ncbi:Eco57I restriction-modification methylase domain-containing protein [Streptomyces kaempferi]